VSHAWGIRPFDSPGPCEEEGPREEGKGGVITRASYHSRAITSSRSSLGEQNGAPESAGVLEGPSP
jgi:hypothetical protein